MPITKLPSQQTEQSRLSLSALLGARATGAVAGQMSQALASFVLQVLAARQLGASGLGLFALIYSLLVLATAVNTGFVGDPLTVLDRRDARIRAGLQRWGLVTALVAGAAAAAAASWTHLLDTTGAVLFGAAMAVFLLEDSLRRLLMASMRFWSLVAVDGVGLFVSAGTIAMTGRAKALNVDDFLLALLLGQVAAGLTAGLLLPTRERTLARWRPAAVLEVARFGVWRGAQQGIRPLMLTVARVLLTIAVGRAVFGQLEAGRVYMAPAMLVVQGLGTYLMASYARDRHKPMRALLRRADRASALMLALTLGGGVVATLTVPLFGHLVTGGNYPLERVAVFGWAVYAASSAVVMPFASLAAVRGRQALVVGLRLADSALSIAALLVLLYPLGVSANWAPYALAIGSFFGGWFIRSQVIGHQPTEVRP